MADSILISSLIVDQLGGGEKGLLSLTVAVRHALHSERIKGDLSQMVRSSLRKLVASETVIDADGLYSLSSRK